MTGFRHASRSANLLATLAGAALILCAHGGAALAQAAAPGTGGGGPFIPAVFVNDQVITAYDLDQRARLLALLGAPAEPLDARDSMIDDRLKRSAAAEAGIASDRAQTEGALGRFASARGVNAQQLQNQLAGAGVSRITLRDFIETELLWSGYVRRSFAARAQVSDLELQDEIDNSERMVQVAYDLSEVSIPFARDEAGARALALRVSREINGGADVAALARRHSRSPTAAAGGRVGVMPQDRLPPQVRAQLQGLTGGQATAPVEVPGGVVVLVVNARNETRVDLDAQGRDGVRSQMLEDRLTRLADGRLAELRGRAFIDVRR
jgi:parvulin-like peptidyl-prolyl isomerase